MLCFKGQTIRIAFYFRRLIVNDQLPQLVVLCHRAQVLNVVAHDVELIRLEGFIFDPPVLGAPVETSERGLLEVKTISMTKLDDVLQVERLPVLLLKQLLVHGRGSTRSCLGSA